MWQSYTAGTYSGPGLSCCLFPAEYLHHFFHTKKRDGWYYSNSNSIKRKKKSVFGVSESIRRAEKLTGSPEAAEWWGTPTGALRNSQRCRPFLGTSRRSPPHWPVLSSGSPPQAGEQGEIKHQRHRNRAGSASETNTPERTSFEAVSWDIWNTYVLRLHYQSKVWTHLPMQFFFFFFF